MTSPSAFGDARAHALTDRTLQDLPPSVDVPDYDRDGLTPAVVHIGVGGFHRARQAVYFDDLARRGISDWGVIGLGRPGRRKNPSALDCASGRP
jgi:mannitol 2-dehydrogenase